MTALVVTVAAPAYAAVTITYNSEFHTIQYFGDSGNQVQFFGCVAGFVSPAPNDGGGAVACSEVESFNVQPSSGGDAVDLSGVTVEFFPNILGNTIFDNDQNADSITGSPWPDLITVGPGDTVSAAGGDDHIKGAGGTVDAGEGNDVVLDSNAGTGGPGDDRFVDTLSLDGITGGTGDDIFEIDLNAMVVGQNLEFALTPTHFVVSNGPDSSEFPVSGFEHAAVDMPGGGTQHLDASAFPGDLTARGFGGPDFITGTKGSDYLHGGYGNDTIEARDGLYDTVICGPGTDAARVDGFDTIVGCESVTYAKPKTSAIRGPSTIKKSGSGTFKFSSNVPGSVFQCKIDKARWRVCSSPFKVFGAGLTKGKHTLSVRAGYPKGNWDATPSKKSFTVVP